MSEKRTWLEGPLVPGENEDPNNLSAYPGKNFGLPHNGPGSLATLFTRMGALAVDWLLSYGIGYFISTMTHALGDYATAALIVFVILRVLTVWLFAQSPGHATLGIGVARLDDPNKRVGFWRSLVRALLTVFLLPPVIQDTDGRGMHDRATGTAVIRTR